MDTERIQRNAKTRHVAEAGMELLTDHLEEEEVDEPRFWECMLKHVKDKQDKKEKQPPMTYEEARKFALATEMPYGKYVGRLIRDIPPQYFLNFENPFAVQLERYLASPYFEQMQQQLA